MTTVLTPEQLQSRERFSKIHREMVKQEAALDATKDNTQTTLWNPTIRGGITNINYRYTISTNPIILFEWDMHDLWHTFIESAKVTDAEDAGQDRLVCQMLYAREMGTLTRTTTGEHEEAITHDGFRVWADLPYLVQDMRKFWQESNGLMSAERRNLAAFIARLVALGVFDTQLVSCGLVLFRDALETPRRLTDMDPGEDVPISELLPACQAWLQQCRHKLVILAMQNSNVTTTEGEDAAYAIPGELARDAGIRQSDLSIERWVFWRQRFKDLSRCENAEMAKHGRSGFGWMINVGREMGFKIPGEAEYHDKVRKYLDGKRERKEWKDGKEGITSSEGMSIHSDDEEQVGKVR